MSKHEAARRPSCLVPGCVSNRWPDSVVCGQHWRRLTVDERNQIIRLQKMAGIAAFESNQQALDQVCDEWAALFERIAPELANRPATPLKNESAPQR